MTDPLDKISDEDVNVVAQAMLREGYALHWDSGDHPDTDAATTILATLVASGWRPEADVLREAAEAYAKHWRSAAGVGWAVDLPSSQAGFVAWLENRAAEIDRATALEPSLPLPVAAVSEAEIADLRAITNAAIHYVNCDHEEANTGEPWDALVHAVRVHERREQESSRG